jgi:hypothetical protein
VKDIQGKHRLVLGHRPIREKLREPEHDTHCYRAVANGSFDAGPRSEAFAEEGE